MKNKKCLCEDRIIDNPYILDHYSYSITGWTLLLIGISATPTKLKKTCTKCNRIVEETTNPERLKKHTGR